MVSDQGFNGYKNRSHYMVAEDIRENWKYMAEWYMVKHSHSIIAAAKEFRGFLRDHHGAQRTPTGYNYSNSAIQEAFEKMKEGEMKLNDDKNFKEMK